MTRSGPQERSSIPICAAALMVALLAGCGDLYEGLPMRPVGYWGNTQLVEEQATGCLYSVGTRARTQEAPVPFLRPDGSQVGCRSALEADTNASGCERQRMNQNTAAGEGKT